MVSWVIVKLPHKTSPKGDHIPHEQKYNTRHGLSAIPNKVRREIRRQPCHPEVQQEAVVHLLLEVAKCGIPCLSVQTPAQPSKPAHGGRAEAHSRHAPQKSRTGHDRVLAPPASAGLHPLPGESVSHYAQNGHVSARKAEKDIQTKAL